MKQSSLLAVVAVVLLAGCASLNKPKKSSLDKDAQAAKDAAEAAPTAPPTEVAEASLHVNGVDYNSREDLKTIPFDYDSAKLSEEALSILKANADVIKGDREMVVLVAGHCDERGTVAYNLALGQKRAKEVRDYYIRLGVNGTKVATISYGKEKPGCSESTEDCWSQNRRAETRVRVKK